MIAKKLRAVATALVLGTAAVAGVGIVTAPPAYAAVRAAVGKPLQNALADAKTGNYSAAMAHVREAEGVSGLSAEERKVIEQTKNYIEVASGGSVGVSSSQSAQAKFDADYRAGRFRDVIADQDLLRRYGILNGANMVIVAQAYYRMGDFQGCLAYTSEHGNLGAEVLDMEMRCAFETHNDTAMRKAAEQVVAVSPTPEHWNQVLKITERSPGLTDPQRIDMYRLRVLTGALMTEADYFSFAQLLLAGGIPSEAVAVIQKGMQAHVLVDARAQKLADFAKKAQAADLANLPKRVQAANASKGGDELVKLGQDYLGMGRYQDAVGALKQGVEKGAHDPDDAQIDLGRAYYGAGQKGAALAALGKANTTKNGEAVARLWEIYIRSH